MSEDTIFIRQWNILRLLAIDSRGWTLSELANKFKISTKTAKRDILLLEKVFGELHSTNERHGRKRYYVNRMILSFNLSLDKNELLALYIGQKLMTPFKGTCFWKGIQSGGEKIKKALSHQTVNYAERVAPCFHQFEYAENHYSGKGDLINTLLEAMEHFLTVKITYRSLASDKSKTYEIHPYNFLYYGGALYIVGFSCKDQDIRFWKTDRLEKIQETTTKFVPPVDFDIDKYMANAIVPFVSQQGTIKAIIRFKGSMARFIQEQKLKTVKKIIKEKSGAVKVIMEVEKGIPFIRWILSFGKNAEILEPIDLQNALVDELNEISAQYKQ